MSGKKITRRAFLAKVSKTAFGSALLFGGTEFLLSGHPEIGNLHAAGIPLDKLIRTAPDARYWVSANAPGVNCLLCHTESEVAGKDAYAHPNNAVKCLLCARECLIETGKRGKCETRINIDGVLKSLVYGRPISVHVDPIEKKPFYHFLPGSRAFSMATSGCPLECGFCQNWQISQSAPEDFRTDFIPPETIVNTAGKKRSQVIAFTYNEPTVFTEYLTDIARAGRKKGLRHVLISCGYMNEKPLDEMCDVLDAIKIDLKGYDKNFYRNVCKAELEPVLRTIRKIAKSGVHLEIVNLVVPTLNDSEKMLKELANWIANEIGPDVPVHFTRFHPDYKMLNLPPTPVATLERAYGIAKQAGLRYPFVGNVPGHRGNNTYCPACGKTLIPRTGFFVTAFHVENGHCKFCKEKIAGVWR